MHCFATSLFNNKWKGKNHNRVIISILEDSIQSLWTFSTNYFHLLSSFFFSLVIFVLKIDRFWWTKTIPNFNNTCPFKKKTFTHIRLYNHFFFEFYNKKVSKCYYLGTLESTTNPSKIHIHGCTSPRSKFNCLINVYSQKEEKIWSKKKVFFKW